MGTYSVDKSPIFSGVDSSGGEGDDHGIIVGQRKRGREAPERGEGVGGGVPPPSPRKFCIFVIEIKQCGAHLFIHSFIYLLVHSFIRSFRKSNSTKIDSGERKL